MEINGIQQSTQPNYSNNAPAVKKDGDKNTLFGFGFRDYGKEKGVVDLSDFNNPEIAQKAQEQGLIGRSIDDSKTQKQLTEIYRQSTDKTEVLETYNRKHGYRVYSRENLEDNSSVNIITNEKTGLQQEITIDSDKNTTVRNYTLDANGDPVEYTGFLISNTSTGKIYTLDEFEEKLKDPDFDLNEFLEETAIPYDIHNNDKENIITITLEQNGELAPTILQFKKDEGFVSVYNPGSIE